jgi:hypothetical protein
VDLRETLMRHAGYNSTAASMTSTLVSNRCQIPAVRGWPQICARTTLDLRIRLGKRGDSCTENESEATTTIAKNPRSPVPQLIRYVSGKKVL